MRHPVRRTKAHVAVVSSAALATTMMLTAASSSDQDGQDDDVFAPVSADAEPVSADVDLVDFDADSQDVQTLSGEDGASEVLVSREDLPDLAVIGVTWAAGTAPEDLEVQFRTQDASGWGQWEDLERESIGEPQSGEREGTEPHVVLEAEDLEVRLVSESGAEIAPQNAHLAVIDPGQAQADTASVTDTATMDAQAAEPTIHSRAQWGADESIRFWDPEQGDVQGLTIHHTAGVNGYSADEVPAIIRGIYHFHTEEWGNGWGDIGYNVLVDRFGRAWEGRYGGVDEPIIGAHAAGLNASMSGLSLMGNHAEVAVSDDAFDTLARVGAWKLDLHGVDAHGTTTVNGNSYNRINGHRDSSATACPGDYMYNRLGEFRDLVEDYQD